MNAFITALAVMILMLAGIGSVFSADPKMERGKMEERIETLATWGMLEALDLDQATADKVLEIRRKFAAQRKELNHSLKEDLATLRRMMKEPSKSSADQELAEIVGRVRDTRKKLRALKEERIDEVSKVLTIRQQAQLILFFQDFWKQIRGMAPSPHRLGPPDGREKDGSRPPGHPPGPPPLRPGPGGGPDGDSD
jgi:Spy/CpxP family protein refolding chaperone